MIWRIDVFSKNKESSKVLSSQIKDLGIEKDVSVYVKKIYLIEADFDKKAAEKIASELLIDPVVEKYSLGQGLFPVAPEENQILITYNAGVSDPVVLSLEKAIRDLNLTAKTTRIGRFYEFDGLSAEEIDYISPKILYNSLIEHPLIYKKHKDTKTLDEFSGKSSKFELVTVDMENSDDNELKSISDKGCLSLTIDEMRIIKDYFKKLKRNPTDCELETIATLWSEHCSHKTFRGLIQYQETDVQGNVKKETVTSLIKETIMKATTDINHDGCVSVFHDNSGVVKFDDKNNICFKVETHNHPSSLEPYGGASTGIGGVIRDILGTGSAAKPFANVDIFCFSPWKMDHKDVPQGLLHPKRVINGVVGGVRDYGNRMGIPTVAGAVLFDERFLGNPLVYCGTLGILPKEKSFKKSQAGDLVILCGAKTGRDGIHGATFSSKELDEDTVNLTSAVQIGNPIEEKKVTEAILRARDKNLFESITDCGAGGISSAITELASEHGVEVQLDKVPLKYKGLTYTEIWISESQERMVFFAKEKDLPALHEIFDEEDVEMTVVGTVTDDHHLRLFYEDNKVCDLDMDFIFELPRLEKTARFTIKKEEDSKLEAKSNYNQDLKDLLARPNVAAKDWIVRQYDHEVQAGSVLKSIIGIKEVSVNDASVVRPDLDSDKCVAIGLGINPFYSDIDPYWMAALVIDEALRNIVCVGANLSKTYILDNFSWGSPQDEEVLGGLIRACRGCYDFATYYGVPFISGKDSLYNEYMVGDRHISIPGTLLISAMSVMDDWKKTQNANLKKKDNLLYIVGETKAELGASEYFRMQKNESGALPRVNKETAKKTLEAVSAAINKGLVSACHDMSEGGLAVAISEMCIGSDMGANIFLPEVPISSGMLDYELLFSESPTRFMVEVDKDKKEQFQTALEGISLGLIGCVSDEKKLVVYGKDKECINIEIEQLRDSWMKTFEEFRK